LPLQLARAKYWQHIIFHNAAVQRVLSAKKEDIRGCGTIERPRNFILKHFATAKFIFPKNIRAKASFLKTNIGETLKNFMV